MHGERTFTVTACPPAFGDAVVRKESRYLLAQVSASQGAEAELALCLSALVEAGVIDVEKLRAALVLAEPVAREKVAEAHR